MDQVVDLPSVDAVALPQPTRSESDWGKGVSIPKLERFLQGSQPRGFELGRAMGRDYWQPLIDFVRNRLVAEKTIDAEDCDRIFVTDSAEEAVSSITQTVRLRFGLTYGPRYRRRWFLWE